MPIKKWKSACPQTLLHRHTYTPQYTQTFLKGMNNSTQEREVCGVVWHIAGTNLPAARGSAEWTQLCGWFGARAGGPLGDRQTPPRSWGSGKKYTTHTHTHKSQNTHTRLFAFMLLSFTLSHQGETSGVRVKERPPPGARCSSCWRVYFSFVFVVIYLFFLHSLFSFLASVALLLKPIHAVSLLNDKGIP